MPISYDYPATLERDEDGRFVACFPDFGWGATDGESREEVLHEAGDGSAHDIYRHADIEGILTLPRHRRLSPAVARSIAKKAGWFEEERR